MTQQIPSPFSFPAFRAFFTAKIGSTLAQIMMVVVIGWQVYDIARNTMPIREAAFYLGLVGLAQFLPVFLLSLFVGVIADKFDRRHIARISVAIELLCASALAYLSFTGSHILWPLFAVALLLGVARAFASPSLSALAPNLVPSNVLPSAIAWNSMGWQVGAVLGPVVGGLAYDFGSHVPYVMAAVFLSISLFALFQIPPVKLPPATGLKGWAAVREGLDYVRGNKIVFGSISLDMFAVILAGATAMLPIYARDILMVGPSELGWLRAAPAVGAGLMAFWLTRYPIKTGVGRKMFVNVALFTIATITFGLSTQLWMALASLFVLGAADMVSVYVRSSLIQLHTPDSMRGRVSAVSMLFVSASNELGEFRAGSMAALVGPVIATVGGGALALVITLAWIKIFPELWNADTLDVPEDLKG